MYDHSSDIKMFHLIIHVTILLTHGNLYSRLWSTWENYIPLACFSSWVTNGLLYHYFRSFKRNFTSIYHLKLKIVLLVQKIVSQFPILPHILIFSYVIFRNSIYRYLTFITLVSKIIICVHSSPGPSNCEERKEFIVEHIYANFASLTKS